MADGVLSAHHTGRLLHNLTCFVKYTKNSYALPRRSLRTTIRVAINLRNGWVRPLFVCHWSSQCVAGRVKMHLSALSIPTFLFPPPRSLGDHCSHTQTSLPLPRISGGVSLREKCKFSHDLDSISGMGAPPPGQNASPAPTSATSRTRSGRSGNPAPRSVCDFYRNTG